MNVLDDFNREGLGNEVDFPLPAEWVVRSLNRNDALLLDDDLIDPLIEIFRTASLLVRYFD